ncbi:response regulator [Desulfogranum mediterraneum]|uniref:response regulator n=1 Tax=Desulfogranum mediterraneum TaxID=160661 RepID=UPI00040AB762|nr:response regulator [Desulfogranum mediterraneum]
MKDRILIVDDEAVICSLLQRILEDAGYQCTTAASAAQGRARLREEHFDLLMTDMYMPGETGAQLARHVQEAYPKTAIVMVTVIDDPDQAKEILEIGIYGYIIKPFAHNMVLITVENALRRHKLEMKEQAYTALLEAKIAQRTETLREQLEFFQVLMDTIPLPLYYKDDAEVYRGCNQAFARYLQRPSGEIIGRTVGELVGHESATVFAERDLELRAKGGVQIFEQTVTGPDGQLQDMLFHRARVGGQGRAASGILAVMLDITKRKKTLKLLHTSEEKLRTIMDGLHIGVVMVNLDNEILQVNRQIQRWFAEAAPGRPYCEQFFAGLQNGERRCWGSLIAEQGKEGAAEIIQRLVTDVGERDFAIHVSMVKDRKGVAQGVILLFEDVTEKIAVEQELRQAQKLEAIGQLAAGIAHEINTPVQFVGDNLNFLDEGFVELHAILQRFAQLQAAVVGGKPTQGMVEELAAVIEEVDLEFLLEEIPATISQSRDGVRRVGDIVRAMREFSHPGSDDRVVVDINAALENTLTVSRNEWKYVAEVETDFAPELPAVSCLPADINQVFLNIIVNAAHAIQEVVAGEEGERGTITIRTSFDRDFVRVQISDTGLGIPGDVQERIFDPFFTTKAIGKGTGQGLAIARNVVVEKHQGQLWFEPRPGGGSTFIIQLPLKP